jgi:hypothetical protein
VNVTNVNKKLIARTRILCTDHPQHARHEVRLFDGGSVECDCGDDAVTEGRRLGTAVSLGTANALRRSCAGLIAFVVVGLPRLVAARVDATGVWGGWKDAWTSYATNSLVREAYCHLVHARDAEHAELLKTAHRALSSCGRYRDGMSTRDFGDEICFVPNGEVKVGATVALYSSDSWTVPLQKDWLESVGKAKPVIDGRFIVGMSEHPGFVYAIDGSNERGFEICEFAVIGGKLGKIAVSK